MFRHVRRLARNFAFSRLRPQACSAPEARRAFPERPITLIVPWAAGGGTDAVARQIASMLERDLKQPVNVEPHGRVGRGRPPGDRVSRA